MDPLSRLFGSSARLKLLRLFLFNDDVSYSVADAAFRSKVPTDAARKEVRVLVASGIVGKRSGKDGTVYRANRRFPQYEALTTFLRSTGDIKDVDMVSLLKRAGTLRLVVLSGIFTGVDESKVDLLVVGDKLDEKLLDAAVRTLEAELGRELRFATFSTETFRYRLGVYDRLIRDIFDYPHRRILDKVGV